MDVSNIYCEGNNLKCNTELVTSEKDNQKGLSKDFAYITGIVLMIYCILRYKRHIDRTFDCMEMLVSRVILMMRCFWNSILCGCITIWTLWTCN